MSAPHVQRCTVTRRFGDSRHGNVFQCKLADPHPAGPGQPCDFGIDAEVYGRDLNIQRPEWLAAQIRDAQALLRNRQARIEELQAVAAQLAAYTADGIPLTYRAGQWVRTNVPTAAARLDLIGARWHNPVENP